MSKPASSTVPTLPAYHRGAQLFVWCQYCAEWHAHDRNAAERSCAAPCQVISSPYRRTGYTLTVAGEWPLLEAHDA